MESGDPTRRESNAAVNPLKHKPTERILQMHRTNARMRMASRPDAALGDMCFNSSISLTVFG